MKKGLFGIGKSKEQKQKEIELERQVVSALREIYVFPGNKEEFEDFIGYKTSWVDLGRKNKGVIWSPPKLFERNPFYNYEFEFQREIVDSSVVALVNVHYTYDLPYSGNPKNLYYGMPVKKVGGDEK